VWCRSPTTLTGYLINIRPGAIADLAAALRAGEESAG
jgi:hypothetical protein